MIEPVVDASFRIQTIFHPSDFSHDSEVAFAHALKLALVAQGLLSMLHVSKHASDTRWTDFPRVRPTLERWGTLPPGSERSAVIDLGLQVKKVISEHDVTLLRRFGQATELAEGSTLYEYMRFVGQDLVDYLRVAREGIDFVKNHSERWSIPLGDDIIEVVFLPRTDPPAAEPSSEVNNYIRAEGLDKTVAAIVYPDRRGEGYGIGRYEDHPKLDFSRVENDTDVHFAHKSGFMCKTSATDPERLQELIAAAWDRGA